MRLPTKPGGPARWRMYYTRSGRSHDYITSPAEILSSISDDMITWHPEPGVR